MKRAKGTRPGGSTISIKPCSSSVRIAVRLALLGAARPAVQPDAVVERVGLPAACPERRADQRALGGGERGRPAVSPPPLPLPLYTAYVPAGFPSPADDDVEGRLDLNQHLIRHPAATFFVRVSGESMLGAGIHPGDLLVVDRALEPAHNKVVIAVVNGELTVKRLCIREGQVWLLAENERYAPIVLSGDMDLQIWGVVTNVIHAL